MVETILQLEVEVSWIPEGHIWAQVLPERDLFQFTFFQKWTLHQGFDASDVLLGKGTPEKPVRG